MEISIRNGPASTVADCLLKRGETLTTEGGCMIAMEGDPSLETSTHRRGQSGAGKALKRLLAGESLFLNHYTASRDETRVMLAPRIFGDIVDKKMSGEDFFIQGGSYLGHYGDVKIDTEWRGLKNLFAGESLFWIKASGTGGVLFNSFGSLYTVDVDGSHIVDTSHTVAFEGGLGYTVGRLSSGWMSSYLSGEGLVVHFSGKGRVWCQSHNSTLFGDLLKPHLKTA